VFGGPAELRGPAGCDVVHHLLLPGW